MIRKTWRLRHVLTAGAGILFALLVLTFYLWHLNELTRLGLETSRLQKHRTLLQEEVRNLEATKAHLLRLERVESIAREKLHLSDPRTAQIFYEKGVPR